MLLPSSSADEDAAMTSFVAALHLGLRLYFHGSIDHLKGCVDERPVSGTALRRKYLVLYDQVPGGTGYLKQLSQKPEIFLEVLRLALQHLKDCKCATRDDHETDGCHRCILQSRHRRDHAGLSRTTAIHLLDTILQHTDQLERVDRVSDIDIHPLIQSELEKSFLESMRAVPGAQLQAKIVRGKPGYLWRCGDSAWEVALQVDLPAGPGLEVSSIPDFVFYPVRADLSRPMAVFLDGFKFHADEASGHNRVAKDVQQRQALVNSGKFWVWSFSWEDIQFRNDPSKIPATQLGETNAQRRNEIARQLLAGDELALAQSAASYTSWSLFLEFLARPAAVFWEKVSYLYALALPLQLQPTSLEHGIEALRKMCQEPTTNASLVGSEHCDGLGGSFNADGIVTIVLMTNAGVKERDASGVFLLLRFDDDTAVRDHDFPRHWRGFLRLLNRLQFLSHSHVVTVRGCKHGMFSGVPDAYRHFLAGGSAVPPTDKSRPGSADALPPDFDLAHQGVTALLRQVLQKRLLWPVIGYELEENGRVAATAETAWPDCRLALIAQEMVADHETFNHAGWRVFLFGSEGITPQDTETIISILSSQS